jgi:nucleotide-binding universal stress UspA family protein
MGEPEIDDGRLLDLALGLHEDPALRQAAERSPQLRRRLDELTAELRAISGELPRLLRTGSAGDALPRDRWRILLALDDSPRSGRACAAAERLAASSAGTVIVFHVRGTAPLGSASISESQSEAAELLGSYLDELREEGIAVESALGQASYGHVAESILRAADELAADLIVLGADSRPRLLSSLSAHRIAKRVTAAARCPVLIVR